MKPGKKTLRPLSLPLVALAVSLLLGAAMVTQTWRQLQQEQTRLGQMKTVYLLAQQKIMRSDDEKNLIVRYAGDYLRLQEEGFIGTESRISWLDALRSASDALKLPGVEYDINPQQSTSTLQPSGGKNAGLKLRQTTMKLRINLLHEEDLLRFFDSLAAQHAGVFSIEECAVQRSGTAAQSSALLMAARVQPNLQADCQLAWYTLSTGEVRP